MKHIKNLTLTFIFLSSILFSLPMDGKSQQTNETKIKNFWRIGQEAMERRDYPEAEIQYLKLVKLVPNVPQMHSNLGLSYYLQNKYEQASFQFEIAIKLNSNLFYPHYFLGSIRRIQKRNNQAIKSIKKALKLQPNNHEALKELALNYIATNKIRLAIEIYQGFLKNKPKDIGVLYDLGVIYINLTKDSFDRVANLPESPFSSLILAHHYSVLAKWSDSKNWADSARTEFKRTLNFGGNIPNVKMELAQLELNKNNLDIASELFKEAIFEDSQSYITRFGLAEVSLHKLDVQNAIRYINEAAKIRPEFFEPYPEFSIDLPKHKITKLLSAISSSKDSESFGGAFLQAVIASQIGDLILETKALSIGKRKLKFFKLKINPPNLISTEDFEKDKYHGLELLRQKRYEDGTRFLSPLLNQKSDDLELPVAISRSLLSMKRFDAATRLLEPYARDHKNNPEIHYLLGLSSQGAAEKNMQLMISTDPQSYRVRWLMGRAYFARELYGAAIIEFQAALQLQPNNSDLLIGLGNIYLRQMKYPEATDSFRRSVKNNPRNALAQLKLGDSLLLDRKAEEAIPHFRAAVDLDSSMVQAHARLGKSFALLGKYQDAVRELELALNLDEDGSIHYQLGTFYNKLGEKEKAMVTLKKSQKLRKENLKKQQLQVMGMKSNREGIP